MDSTSTNEHLQRANTRSDQTEIDQTQGDTDQTQGDRNLSDSNDTLTPNPLTEREKELAQLLVKGFSNAEIARELTISPNTVKVHVRNIYEKLQVSSRIEASTLLMQRGWAILPGVELPPVESAPEPPAPAPEPPAPTLEPLHDLPAQLWPWQKFYLSGALLLSILAIFIPNLISRTQTSPNLLSDAALTALGKPIIETLPRWDVRTPVEKPRSRLAVVRVEDRLYAIGGERADGQVVKTVDVYDLNFNYWRSVRPLPSPLANLAVVALGQHIYVAGGNRIGEDGIEVISDAFLQYSVEKDEWLQVGTLPNPLVGAALVSVEESLYLIGGWDGEAMQDAIWRLTPGTDEAVTPSNWAFVTRLETPRAFLGATAIGDEIYVAGGYDGRRALNLASVYQTKDDVWRTLPTMSNSRGGLQLVYDGLAIFALGGGWTQSIENHERFDPSTGLWSNFPSPIQGEWRHFAAASDDGYLYLLGGWGGDYLDTHLHYQSSFRTLFPDIRND